MKKATVALFLLLSTHLAYGRNVTEQEIASALKRALTARDNLSVTADVQVSNAVASGKDVCIEYRTSNGPGVTISGLAVYRTEEGLVFLDNSWIWERACLSGKYGQRRNGKDLTQALNASLAAPVRPQPAVMGAAATPPKPVIASSAPLVASAAAPLISPAQPTVVAAVASAPIVRSADPAIAVSATPVAIAAAI